jgi:dihydroflavonol-4-reductase
MIVLVTGASGLIGSNIAREAVAAGHRVRAMVRPSSNLMALADLPVELVQGDVLDRRSLLDVMEGCDAIVHAAAIFAWDNAPAVELIRVAVEGTRNVVDAAADRNIARLVLTSSSVVCGSSMEPVPRTEDSPPDDTPEVSYVRAKVMQEAAAFERGAERNVEVVAACPSMTIGGKSYRLSPSNGVLVSFLKDPMRLTFAGGFNVVSVRDVARGHLLLLEKGMPGTRYLLASEDLTWREIHECIAELCGTGGPYYETGHTASYLAATADELLSRMFRGRRQLATRTQARMVGRYYYCRHDRAAELGFAPQPARQALAEALSWLVGSHHISRETRARLRLSPELYRARYPAESTA